MLLNGNSRLSDSELGLQKLKEAFNDGYLNAGSHLADTYFSGKNLAHNIELGHDCLLRTANSGDERTMAILGHYLVTGGHGKKNVSMAPDFLHQAIQFQYLPAYLWLGTLYKNGQGVDRNQDKASEWFKKGILAENYNYKSDLSKLTAQLSPNTKDNKLFH